MAQCGPERVSWLQDPLFALERTILLLSNTTVPAACKSKHTIFAPSESPTKCHRGSQEKKKLLLKGKEQGMQRGRGE